MVEPNPAISLPRCTPEQQGVPTANIEAFVHAAEREIQFLHSFMLLRHGSVIAEGWWSPWRADEAHMLFSLSKSFASSAIGMAIDEGILKLDETILNLFPGDAPSMISANLAAMQVGHLLSMSSGHAEDTTEAIMHTGNPCKAFMELPVDFLPGTHFVYNSGATFMLSATIQKLTGLTLVDYLTPRLFQPLGISKPVWDSHPVGINFGGWGLHLKTEEIARFGQLILQKGNWEGQQLIPADWVEAATSKQISNAPDPNPDWEQGYGFQFWRCVPQGVFRGDGAFGQFCIVMPEEAAVMVITAGVQAMQPVLDLVWKHILPGLQQDTASIPPKTMAVESPLQKTLDNLFLAAPKGEKNSSTAVLWDGRTFQFDENELFLGSLCFHFSQNRLDYQVNSPDGQKYPYKLAYGSGIWVNDTSILASPAPNKVASSGNWISEDTFELTICHIETPFITTIIAQFGAEELAVTFRYNVSFGPKESPKLVGKPVK